MQGLTALAVHKFKRSYLGVVSICFIASVGLVSIFAYVLSPDRSQYANQMHLDTKCNLALKCNLTRNFESVWGGRIFQSYKTMPDCESRRQCQNSNWRRVDGNGSMVLDEYRSIILPVCSVLRQAVPYQSAAAAAVARS